MKTKEEIALTKRKHYLANRKKYLSASKAYNREHKEERHLYDKEYYLKHKERIDLRVKNYYLKHKDKKIESDRKHYENNLELLKAQVVLRRLKKKKL